MAAIETFGEDLPGLLMECVVDPEQPERLLLQTWDGRRITTAPKVEYAGVSYIPKTLNSGLVQSVRFATQSAAIGSMGKVISSLRQFLSTYVHLEPEAVNLLVAFGLATWFCDVMPVAPVLYILGPESVVSHALRLLACFCRRPVLLGDVDFGGLATLPKGLGATLLINQRCLGERVRRTLLASNRRHFGLIHGSERLDLYGGKAFSSDNFPADVNGLVISISPPHDSLPALADSQERIVAQNFQSKLLRHRMVDYERVRSKGIDTSPFVPEMRDVAHSWLSPIADYPELFKSVFAEILCQSREAAGARFLEPKPVVVEAALFFCHKPDVTQFFVGELAQKINALLLGRHEESKPTAKKVGLVLRELGIHGQRVTEGYKVTLTEVVRQRIHQLAVDYQVPTLDSGVSRCRECHQLRELRQP